MLIFLVFFLFVNLIAIMVSIICFTCHETAWVISYYYIHFSTADNQFLLYFALVKPKFEHSSIAWNSMTITDSDTAECIQTVFSALPQ